VEESSVNSLLCVGNWLWVGTSGGALLLLHAETGRLITDDNLTSLRHASPYFKARKMALVQVSGTCVWVSKETEILVFQSDTHLITHTLSNGSIITAMAVCEYSGMVWVADLEGFISIWDPSSMEKYHQFEATTTYQPAQSMAVFMDWVWLAVGRSIIAVHSQTLHKVQCENAHSDRIHGLTSIPNANQVWSCARDGTVSVWKLSKDLHQLKKIHQHKLTRPVKFVQAMLDRKTVCTGTFDGKLFLWDTQTFAPTVLPLPAQYVQGFSLLCALDTEQHGLWLGVESRHPVLLRHPRLPVPMIGASRLSYNAKNEAHKANGSNPDGPHT